MHRSAVLVGPLLLVLGLAAGDAEAARVRVVASTPDLKALTAAVGGDLVEVDSLARGDQNPHDVEIRPSLMVKLRRADLLVRNGAGGDPWVEPLAQGAGNPRVLRGASGHVDVSAGITLLGVPEGRVDRSRGDVHPEGNPHFTLDPGTAPAVTGSIVEGLGRVAPEHRPAFEARRRDFLARLEAALARWREALGPFRGARVVGYHELWTYFLQRFGLVQAAAIEDRPGIPPSPAHLAALIRRMKTEQIRVVIAEPWADRKLVELVAREAGARAVVLAPAVGAVKEAATYEDMLEHNVSALAAALRAGSP
jgi:ABC-type Zn uptake system ZnuABC Zn-binding protein ZnuA